jgi:hypothetical protein
VDGRLLATTAKPPFRPTGAVGDTRDGAAMTAAGSTAASVTTAAPKFDVMLSYCPADREKTAVLTAPLLNAAANREAVGVGVRC